MIVLGLDTATKACSAAVWQDGRVLSGDTAAMERGQAEALMPMVLSVIAAARISFSDLDLLAVTVGPGAFTGLRVGLAAARGIALAAEVPCVGVTTLEAIAAAMTPAYRGAAETVLVALDTKRGDLYAQAFAGDGRQRSAPLAMHPGELATLVGVGPVRVAGDAAPVAVAALRAAGVDAAAAAPAVEVADAGTVAAIAAGRWLDGETGGGAPAPLYLRPPEAKVAAAGGRRRP